jgi:hypothetical protein
MSTKDSKTEQTCTVHSANGSFKIERRGKKLEILNYFDKTIEVSIEEYGNEIGTMLDEEETKALINWLIKNGR